MGGVQNKLEYCFARVLRAFFGALKFASPNRSNLVSFLDPEANRRMRGNRTKCLARGKKS